MGMVEKSDGSGFYRQEDGEITARFATVEEKKVLSHEGSVGYRRVFNLLVLVGMAYLAVIFLRV